MAVLFYLSLSVQNDEQQRYEAMIATYPANDPLREHLFQRWTNKEAELDKEFYPQLTGKLKN